MSFPIRCIVLLSLLALHANAFPTIALGALPALRGEGARVVDEHGKPVILRGCNLGNWLVIESWMNRWDIADQETLIATLTERFGELEARRLMDLYRDGYIRPRDFEILKQFQFNLVRIPFDSRMLIDAKGDLRPDAFKYLDRGIDMAEAAGMYVILDMHGAPGSQSKQDHTGQRDQNKIWAEPVLQQRFVDLWKTLSQRYKDRTAVVAYDLMNEPYGDFRTDLREPLKALMPRAYEAIRSTGDQHLILFPAGLGTGIGFYGDVKAKGLKQVAFTDHYYPGLFGSPSTLRSHVGVLERTMPEAQTQLDLNGAPMLIGEFNVVLEKSGGDAMMRRYYDEFAKRGWMATMWSYKLLKPTAGVEASNWYLATNADALPPIDFSTSPLADIETWFANLATMELAIDEPLQKALTSPIAPALALPTLPALPTAAPAGRTVPDWTLTDVDLALPSGVEHQGASVSITTAGRDIFGTNDSFTFLHQKADKDVTIVATVTALADSDQWAKAGVMLRLGENPADAASPFVMLNAFTDGSIAFVVRDARGATATETKRVIAPLPCKMALRRSGERVEAFVASGDNWTKVGEATANGPAHVGLAVCSHSAQRLTRASFADVNVTPSNTLPGKIVSVASPTLPPHASAIAIDGDFQTVGSSSDAWSRWGDHITRLDSRGVQLRGEAGLWQNVRVAPGKAYTLAVRARRLGQSKGGFAISLETTVNGTQVVLNERGVDLLELATDEGWTVLQTDAVAASDTMRVLLHAVGESGDVVIDEAALWPSPP